MNILYTIGSIIAGIGIVIGGWFGYTPEVKEVNFGASVQTPSVVALFETTLASAITSSATTLTLVSATTKDSSTLASSTYGMIIDEGTATEEIVLADCTGTACTNITRGLSVLTGTTTITALKQAHRRGASVKVTDAPSLIFAVNVFRGRQNIENVLIYDSQLTISTTSNQIIHANWAGGLASVASTSAYNAIVTGTTITGTTTFSKGLLGAAAYDCVTTSADTEYCQKAYIDGVAVAGASDANQTTKGIVEEATASEIDAGTGTGSTGAELFINPAILATSNSSLVLSFSTTTSVNMATSTIPTALIPSTDYLRFVYTATTTVSSFDNIIFNQDAGANYAFSVVEDGGAVSATAGANGFRPHQSSVAANNISYLDLNISNTASNYKVGSYELTVFSTSSPTIAYTTFGKIVWKNTTSRITQIDVGCRWGTAGCETTKGSQYNISGY